MQYLLREVHKYLLNDIMNELQNKTESFIHCEIYGMLTMYQAQCEKNSGLGASFITNLLDKFDLVNMTKTLYKT